MGSFIDVTGQKFAKLTAVRDIGRTDGMSPKQKWLFICDCGNELVTVKQNVTRGLTTSCGCSFKEKALESFSKLTKKGKLTPIQYSRSGYGIFRCDCGVEKEMRIDGFKNGHAKSCGCFGRIASLEARVKAKTTHAMSDTRFYKIFRGMKYRCEAKNRPHYKRYGGRGIKVEWESFEQFRDDMNDSYEEHVKKYGSENTSINRIDNDGNYNKENCEWSTKKFQARNRRTSRMLNFKGENRTLTEWSEITGISRNVIESRIDRHGWTTEKALTQKIR